MQADGDLWKSFWDAILTRGPLSITFTKVKAHTTTDDVAKGITTEEHRDGNNLADKGATFGTGALMDGLLSFATWMSQRSEEYRKFMHRVHKVIVAVLQQEKIERGARHQQKVTLGIATSKPTVSMTLSLNYPEETEGCKLTLAQPPRGKHRYSTHQKQVEQIHTLLSSLHFSPAPEGETGITWVELFALLRNSGVS